jgi:Na+-driven multidrug efflux pump
MMVVAGLTLWWWADEVVTFMAPDSPGLVAYGAEYLTIMAPTYPLAAGAVVLALALNGAGSTKAPAIIDGVAYILLVCPAALIAVAWLGNDHRSVWGAVAAGNVILAAAYGLWFARGSWRTIRL